MTGSIRTRLAAALGTLALAASGAVIAAPAAHADGPSCANFLANGVPAHNSVDSNVACGLGATGLPTVVGSTLCNTVLTDVAQISAANASSACTKARN
ncbi:hypothetical protein [Streptomyces luteireticuli]|uniref:hypothetical protein n=1 Tax=Streptomyces luteireticuli TaxID=173858 RepID=UPI003556C704